MGSFPWQSFGFALGAGREGKEGAGMGSRRGGRGVIRRREAGNGGPGLEEAENGRRELGEAGREQAGGAG